MARTWTDLAFFFVRVGLVVVVAYAAFRVPRLLFFSRSSAREERLQGLVVHVGLCVGAWSDSRLGHVAGPHPRTHAPAVLPVYCAFWRLLDCFFTN